MKKFKIEPQEDGSLIVTLKPSVKHELIRWVLGENIHIEVLYQEDLRREIAEAAQRSGSVTPLHPFRPNFQWKRNKGEKMLEKSTNLNKETLQNSPVG